MDWKKVLAGVVGALVAFWLLCPLPEISIIVGLVWGGTLSRFFPAWATWTSVAIGVPIGWYIFNHLGLKDRLLAWL